MWTQIVNLKSRDLNWDTWDSNSLPFLYYLDVLCLSSRLGVLLLKFILSILFYWIPFCQYCQKPYNLFEISFQVVAFVLEAFFAEMDLETSEKCEDAIGKVSKRTLASSYCDQRHK